MRTAEPARIYSQRNLGLQEAPRKSMSLQVDLYGGEFSCAHERWAHWNRAESMSSSRKTRVGDERDENATMTPSALIPPCCKLQNKTLGWTFAWRFQQKTFSSRLLVLQELRKVNAARSADGCMLMMDCRFCKVPFVPPDTPELRNVSSAWQSGHFMKQRAVYFALLLFRKPCLKEPHGIKIKHCSEREKLNSTRWGETERFLDLRDF